MSLLVASSTLQVDTVYEWKHADPVVILYVPVRIPSSMAPMRCESPQETTGPSIHPGFCDVKAQLW